MILTDELRNASLELEPGRSFQLITRHDAGSLHAFYRSLSFDERRARFGAAVSDESIAAYCERIDWRSTVVIGCGSLLCWDAVATNVRIDLMRAENASIARPAGRAVLPELLRLSAIAARELLSVQQLTVEAEGVPGILGLARGIGQVSLVDGVPWLDTASVTSRVSSPGRSAPFRSGDRAEAAE